MVVVVVVAVVVVEEVVLSSSCSSRDLRESSRAMGTPFPKFLRSGQDYICSGWPKDICPHRRWTICWDVSSPSLPELSYSLTGGPQKSIDF